MRNILLALVIAVLTTAAPALAELSSIQKRDSPATPGGLPVKRSSPSNPCSVFGPGFIKVEGSETCVKIGGAASVGVGRSIGTR
ncbi:MAG: hypothetical protein QOC84_2621 [Bradyrhizobium sp.]|jgi:hypothetical protein|nr:hypothetical protein [Bradyrhizobium sp.]